MAYKTEVISVISAREGMFSTLSTLFFDRLTEEQIKAMAEQDFSELIACSNETMSSGFNDIWRYLRKRNTGTRQELAVDFSSCFLGTHSYKGLVAQPYESLFTDPSGSLAAPSRRNIHRLYKSERVSLSEGCDYPDDHLSFECEFMMILCRRIIDAINEDDEREALRLLKLQLDFMNEHINAWYRRLHDLSLKFIQTRFYRGVLNIAQGFFDEEPQTIQDLIEAVDEGLEERSSEEGSVVEDETETEDSAETEGAAVTEDPCETPIRSAA